MTIKEYLRQARRLKISIKSKREYINQMYELCGLKSPVNDDVRVMGGEKKGFPHIVEAIVDLTAEIDSQLIELAAMHKDIIFGIGTIEDTNQRTAMELYYLNCHTWEEVAEIMGLSDRHLRRLHGEALVIVDKIIICPVMSAT